MTRTRSTKFTVAALVGSPNRLRALLFGLLLWSPLLSSLPAAHPLPGVQLPPCDPEPETSISPAPNEASSDGSLPSWQSDRAWHFLEAEPAACLVPGGDRSAGIL